VIVWDWILFGGAAIFLVLLNAIFVAGEFSLIRLRYSHFNPDLLEELKKVKRFSRLLDRMDRTLRFLRLGITFFTMALGFVLLPFVQKVVEYAGFSREEIWLWLIYGLAFLLALAFRYVIGELVPRGIALQHPVGTLQTTSVFIWLLRLVAFPFLRPLDLLAKGLLRVFRLDPRVSLNQLDLEAQIRNLEEESEIPTFTQRVFKNVISMRELVVQDVMLPRNQIQYFDVNNGNQFNVKMSKQTGHTRFPLCEGDLDNCIGIVHIKDIYRSSDNIGGLDFKKLARPLLSVGLDDPLENVLEQLLELQLHMALVRDEFGGTVGVVTLENIVEELVGNIQDEFDSETEQIEEIQQDVFIVDGLTPIHDVEEKLDTEFDEEEVSTIGGLITSELGKIPDVGQKVILNNLEIEAIKVDEKRVLSARLRVLPEEERLPEN
jgi:CBS domain containing-hemolysin-like protein